MPKQAKSQRRSAPRTKPPSAGTLHRRRSQTWFWLLGLGFIAAVLIVWALQPGRSIEEDPIPFYTFEVVNSYPHDPDAYCQGLAYADGRLYEGTGRRGQSSLRRVDLESGAVLDRVDLAPDLFGEGITVWQDQIIQLTWKSRLGLIYNKSSFREIERFSYAGEGWGLTHDGRHLIMSDGTSTLRFLDPQNHEVVKTLVVRSSGEEKSKLNELEYIKGEIWANVWYEDYILRISPETGNVVGRINLRSLFPPAQRPSRDAVLNGIAYDAENDRVFVTGKNWPRLYEIRVKPSRE